MFAHLRPRTGVDGALKVCSAGARSSVRYCRCLPPARHIHLIQGFSQTAPKAGIRRRCYICREGCIDRFAQSDCRSIMERSGPMTALAATMKSGFGYSACSFPSYVSRVRFPSPAPFFSSYIKGLALCRQSALRGRLHVDCIHCDARSGPGPTCKPRRRRSVERVLLILRVW